MSDERILELVSAAADGALAEEEQAELGRLLEAAPDARRFQSDLHRLEAILASVPVVKFPDSLHTRIMSRVVRKESVRNRAFGWFRRPITGPAVRYGLAAAFGVLMTMAVYEWQPLLQYSTNYDELVGTIAPSGGADGFDILDSYELRVPGLAGLVQLRRDDERLLLDIRTDSRQPVDIAVDFAAAGLRPHGLTQDDYPLDAIEVADQILRMRAVGRRHMTVSLRRAGDTAFAGEARIELAFSSNGKVLQQGSLSPAM